VQKARCPARARLSRVFPRATRFTPTQNPQNSLARHWSGQRFSPRYRRCGTCVGTPGICARTRAAHRQDWGNCFGWRRSEHDADPLSDAPCIRRSGVASLTLFPHHRSRSSLGGAGCGRCAVVMRRLPQPSGPSVEVVRPILRLPSISCRK
jgi:hypothetical protein